MSTRNAPRKDRRQTNSIGLGATSRGIVICSGFTRVNDNEFMVYGATVLAVGGTVEATQILTDVNITLDPKKIRVFQAAAEIEVVSATFVASQGIRFVTIGLVAGELEFYIASYAPGYAGARGFEYGGAKVYVPE